MIFGVHGILSDGGDSTDGLLDALRRRGLVTREFDWGPLGPIGAALMCKHNGRRLAKAVRGYSRPHAATHSFGAAVLKSSMDQGARYGHVFLFNPAIPPDTVFPEEAYTSITVIANQKDRALLWGELFLYGLGYGDMGRTGYLGPSSRVHTNHGPSPVSRTPAALFPEHGESFSDANIEEWADYIQALVAPESPTGRT